VFWHGRWFGWGGHRGGFLLAFSLDAVLLQRTQGDGWLRHTAQVLQCGWLAEQLLLVELDGVFHIVVHQQLDGATEFDLGVGHAEVSNILVLEGILSRDAVLWVERHESAHEINSTFWGVGHPLAKIVNANRVRVRG